MREVTYSDVDRIRARGAGADEAFPMEQDAFRAFYDRTARPLWVYLARLTGSPQQADDLLQEAYYRFLRAGAVCSSDEHRRHYLYRIATNLVRDARRRPRLDAAPLPEEGGPACPREGTDVAERAQRRADLDRGLARLKPRERELLWLAYGQGSSHREIAAALGLKTASIRPLLARARRRLAALLRGAGARASSRGSVPEE